MALSILQREEPTLSRSRSRSGLPPNRKRNFEGMENKGREGLDKD
jgi:hypothetical protein